MEFVNKICVGEITVLIGHDCSKSILYSVPLSRDHVVRTLPCQLSTNFFKVPRWKKKG